jgi:hypothetical protein
MIWGLGGKRYKRGWGEKVPEAELMREGGRVEKELLKMGWGKNSSSSY